MYLYMKQCVVYKIEWKPYNYSISHLFFRVVYPKLTKTVPAFNFLERTNKNENCKTMLEEFTFVTVDGHKKIDVSVWYRTSLQTLSHTVEYTGEPKKLAHFCTPYNFVKYWSIFNFFHCRNREKFVIVLSLKIPLHIKFTILWNVSVSKASIVNKATAVTTHFESA